MFPISNVFVCNFPEVVFNLNRDSRIGTWHDEDDRKREGGGKETDDQKRAWPPLPPATASVTRKHGTHNTRGLERAPWLITTRITSQACVAGGRSRT